MESYCEPSTSMQNVRVTHDTAGPSNGVTERGANRAKPDHRRVERVYVSNRPFSVSTMQKPRVQVR